MVGYDPISDIGMLKRAPIELAEITEGMSVLNLGSAVGDDAFAIRRIVGDSGRIIGIEYSVDLHAISRQNAGNLGYNNVTFFLRDFKELLFDDCNFDVAIGSERLNILNSQIINTAIEESERVAILKEIYRVLKVDSKFIGTAITLNSEENAVLELLENAGFKDTKILSEEIIDSESGELSLYIDQKITEEINHNNKYLKRIVVVGRK